MNVFGMTHTRILRISVALSLLLLASWVWFNFLTQPQATNLFIQSPSILQKISLGNASSNLLQARIGDASIAELPPLPGFSSPRQIEGIEVLGNNSVSGPSLSRTATDNQLGTGAGLQNITSQDAVTNFADAPVEGGPAPLLPSAQRQNIEIADLPFLINAPPALAEDSEEQIVIAAPSGRLTVNPFAPIYIDEEVARPQRSTSNVATAPSQTSTASANRTNQTATRSLGNSNNTSRAEAEVVQPKIEIGAVPTPRPILPPPSRQSNLPASFSSESVAVKPSLLRAPIRASYYKPSEVPEPVVPEPVVIEVPAEVVEEVVREPVTLDRSRLTGIRLPIAASSQPNAGVSTRAYNSSDDANVANLPSVSQAPAQPIIGSNIAARLPQTAGVRAAVSAPSLQPIGLRQAQLIGRRNVPVVEEEIVEVEVPAEPELRPVQIALRAPEPVAVPVVQAPVIETPVVEEAPVEEEEVVVVEESQEEANALAAQEQQAVSRQSYIASISSTLNVVEPEVEPVQMAVVAETTEQVGLAEAVGASVVSAYVRDNNLSFTGAILGPVSVAIFESRLGSFHVPIGEMIPDTEIRLTNVKRHEVELRQGSESQIIYLDLGQ